MQTMGTAREIYQYGTQEQKEKYVAKLVSAEILACICITEPDAGTGAGPHFPTGKSSWMI